MGNGVDSNIFHDLATLSGAGITMQKAAQIISSSHPGLDVWSEVINSLSQGRTLAKALGENGLISRYEQDIIAVAEFSGRIEQALNWLSSAHEKRYRRVSQLRSKLILPVAVLIIGVAAFSILTLFRNPNISVFTILIQACFTIAIVIAITRIMLNFLKKDSSNFIAEMELFRHSIFYKHLFEQVLFTALVWNIRSGIDFKTAFLKISSLINSKKLKNQLKSASNYCGQGLAVTESIKKSDLPITIELEQVLNIAEASGRWEEAVDHYLKQQQIMLDLTIDSALEWAPRFYYVLILLYVCSIIL